MKSLIRSLANKMLGDTRTHVKSVPHTFKTSLSDNELYPDFCLKASNDVTLFSQFRQNEIYQQILEHVDAKTGEVYLEKVKKNRPELLQHIEKIKQNDWYGSPTLVEYPGIGSVNPTTLRYAKVLGDMMNLFGSLDGKNIAEIGVGYGGQCRVINSICKPSHYTLVDVKPALMLAQSYLDGYILHSVMKYRTMNELDSMPYDLVISNYAFTELRREIQEVYLQKIILRSAAGYITYNDINPADFKSYSREELLRTIPGSRVIEEVPLTHPRNCIIVWGDK